jgi:hypothetical protein
LFNLVRVGVAVSGSVLLRILPQPIVLFRLPFKWHFGNGPVIGTSWLCPSSCDRATGMLLVAPAKGPSAMAKVSERARAGAQAGACVEPRIGHEKGKRHGCGKE